jgi:nucleoside-diphosphate-sugar epimerase
LLRESSADPGLAVRVHRHDGTALGLAAIMREADPDVVFHLASLYLADHNPDQVELLVQSNILFAAQLAEAMTVLGDARLINTGTAWQHFATPEYRPVNLYAATKQAADDLLRYYHDARGLSVLTLKLFDTFGAGDSRRKLVQLLVDAAMSGEEIGLSPGDQVIDLAHVDDVVSGFLVAAARLLDAPAPMFESAFLSGERLAVRGLVDVVAAALGRPVPATFGARPYRAREVMELVDVSGRTLAGWRPRRSLAEALPSLARGLGRG